MRWHFPFQEFCQSTDHPERFLLVEMGIIRVQSRMATLENFLCGEVFLECQHLSLLGKDAGHVLALLVTGNDMLLGGIRSRFPRLDEQCHEGLRGLDLVIG